MIVHSKTLAELTELMALSSTNGEPLPIVGWFFWMEAVLVCCLGLFWFYRLTISLALYDPLFIIPLMQACFILFGGVAGGIFFHEFADLHRGPGGWGRWPIYCLGFACVLIGLYLVRTETSAPTADESAAGAAGAAEVATKPPQLDASPEPPAAVPRMLPESGGGGGGGKASAGKGMATGGGDDSDVIDMNDDKYGVNYQPDATRSLSGDDDADDGGAGATMVVEDITPPGTDTDSGSGKERQPRKGREGEDAEKPRMSGDGGKGDGVNNWT